MASPVIPSSTSGAGATIDSALAETRLQLVVPEDGQSARAISSLLRTIEVLLVHGALLTQLKVGREQRWLLAAYSDYVSAKFLMPYRRHIKDAGISSQQQSLLESQIAKGLLKEANADVLNQWADAEVRKYGGTQLLPLEAIDQGSYEFVFHLASFAAIFGLKEYGLVKDCVQWSCTVIQDFIPVVSGSFDASRPQS